MEKVASFTKVDSSLIEKIEKYQKERNISFEDAVKELCAQSLENTKWGEF